MHTCTYMLVSGTTSSQGLFCEKKCRCFTNLMHLEYSQDHYPFNIIYFLKYSICESRLALRIFPPGRPLVFFFGGS